MATMEDETSVGEAMKALILIKQSAAEQCDTEQTIN